MAGKKTVLSLMLCALLAACGGGGGDGAGSGTNGVNTGDGGGNPPDTPGSTSDTIPPSTIVTTYTPARYSDPDDPDGNFNADFGNALDGLNAQRLACGFGAVQQNTTLDKTAAGHAAYLSLNIGNGDLTLADANDKEDPALGAAFSGRTPLERATAHGYAAASVSELVGNWHTMGIALRSGLDTVYGGQFLLAGHREAGLGGVIVGNGVHPEIMVLDLAVPAGQAPQLLGGRDLASLPCEGQRGITTMHPTFGKSPVAVRDIVNNPLDRPVVAMVRAGQALKVTAFTLTLHGNAVPAHVVTAESDPNKLLQANFAAVVPDQPLQPLSTYTARLVGTNNGYPVDKSWTFTTAMQ